MTTGTTFWDTLPKPIIALSPMDGVTDHPLRHIQKKYGNPMVVFTEFTSVEGICMGSVRLLKDFLYDETQRPIVAQIYGHTPEYFRQTAIALCQLGFDGIDINMGCPAKSVAHRGAGAGLIKRPQLAQEIVKATKRGVQEWFNGATVCNCADIAAPIAAEIEARQRRLPIQYQERRSVPVSVKTRVGYEAPVVETWISHLMASEPVAISIHGRTLKQGYGGDADWEAIGKAVELTQGTQTLLLGNGDVQSMQDALEQVRGYGVDGVLIGRASFGNPFVFQQDNVIGHLGLDEDAPQGNRYPILNIALEHACLYEETFRGYERYHFPPMRKHLGWYARSVPSAKGLRTNLTKTSSAEEVRAVLEEYYHYRRRWEH
ncbi:tRNA-dihydrouridine synthase [Chloroflexi bacterium TSY]|nr:tRNA-dihydrouridine synthase [Chloroflexi bacterium TSY]